ncbi:hypothetical protein DQ04_00771130 [Trypanosoma grayi]|uniref:hypothetical protein n=1 Tax=Trypanosoma grayi TaxID=71804 RepID=UPI0004F46DE4|nr:hypothetical protein DQ04_00771130 [Trypanosoma grayi]KEG13815.1 hypothetical protein DQ04_00771130 [Trypanosoma grayi]
MAGLTQADITEEAIHAEEMRLQECKARSEELQERLRCLQKEVNAANEQCVSIANALQWRRLMAEVEKVEAASSITTAMTAAAKEFRESLTPPPDYDEAHEGIPFMDTDDYADLSPIEGLIEDFLERISDLVRGDGDDGSTDGDESVKAGGDASVRHRHAMLMLLVLTVNMGQLDTELVDVPEADVAAEMEELRESVAGMWQHLLYTDSGFTDAEKEEWTHVLRTFVGAPYDAAA